MQAGAVPMLSRLPKPLAIIMFAGMAMLAVLAARQLSSDREPVVMSPDPLAPRLDAPDVTAEHALTQSQRIDMATIQRMAEEKYGPMPSLNPSNEGSVLASTTHDEPSALERAQRIRDIRRTQGSAAAVVALKADSKLAAQ